MLKKLSNSISNKNIISFTIYLSAFKIAGYVFGFYLFLPFLSRKIKPLLLSIKELKPTYKVISLYFLLMIISSFLGAIYLKDIRVILFWVPYFFVCLLIYIFHINELINNKNYFKNIDNILFKSSIIFLLIISIMNIVSLILYNNWFEIQRSYWIGGSTSFCISAIFFVQIFDRWIKNNFIIFSKFTLLITFYCILASFNNSRLALLYLLLFSFFIFIAAIKKKQLINGLSILTIILVSYSSFSFFFLESYTLENSILPYYFRFQNTVLQDKKTMIDKFQPERSLITEISDLNYSVSNIRSLIRKDFNKMDDRYFELYVGLHKFKNSNFIEKLFGTGWYSSRKTIKSSRDQIIDKNREILPKEIKKQEIHHLQGIIALLLDTGIIGVIFTIYLFGLTTIEILREKRSFDQRLFRISILSVNFICLFIGYPMVMNSYILMFLPQGILFINKRKNLF